LHGDPRHLREIGQGRLTGVRLPARVGGKADGGVEGQVGRHGVELLRVERQHILQALQCIEHHDAREVEGQQTERIARPGLLLGWIDTGNPIKSGFERAEQALHGRAAGVENACHVATKRADRGGGKRCEEGDLQPALPGHFARSGRCV
jgi:hypothetical protein